MKDWTHQDNRKQFLINFVPSAHSVNTGVVGLCYFHRTFICIVEISQEALPFTIPSVPEHP